ncbi:hypothetical protein [Psychroserpens algicola]|uniref:LPXTG-motif cell wall anchor domain-containing protein n=2 Tax=Psychroserpens algicola TaxID=1719034 RepID=A0ABT0H681_9FLAO|nr:hypothetical protein [Psychroserpens algicola]MCK8479894.1 hypothetical protein [Psychroserpens algicola]
MNIKLFPITNVLMPRFVSYILIVIGGIIAIYAQAEADQNQYILIAGIAVLMIGIYSVSRRIPSKKDQEEEL